MRDPGASPILPKSSLNLIWLIKLRWGSSAGQLATILGVYGLFNLQIPLGPLLLVVAIEILSNAVLVLWSRKHLAEVKEWHVAFIMSLDVVLLTLLLFLTGGPENPFSFLYLANIALAAVALQRQWTWMLVGLALVAMGALPFLEYRPLPMEHLTAEQRRAIFQQGMWVAFGVTAVFIVHFLWRVTRALGDRERELGESQQITARQEQLASLATVAAGAAHELATPLGTIALVSKELERNAEVASQYPEIAEDLRLIREQVARCRLILDQMGAGIGRSSEQVIEEISVPQLVRDGLVGVRQSPAVHVEVDDDLRDLHLHLPARAVAQALRAIITNAQDAAADGPRVLVRCRKGEDGRGAQKQAIFEVVDEGPGMSSELLARVSEPFFTTKAPGSGMGLGLYLTRAVVESLGGALRIHSAEGEGTTVQLRLPLKVDPTLSKGYPANGRV